MESKNIKSKNINSFFNNTLDNRIPRCFCIEKIDNKSSLLKVLNYNKRCTEGTGIFIENEKIIQYNLWGRISNFFTTGDNYYIIDKNSRLIYFGSLKNGNYDNGIFYSHKHKLVYNGKFNANKFHEGQIFYDCFKVFQGIGDFCDLHNTPCIKELLAKLNVKNYNVCDLCTNFHGGMQDNHHFYTNNGKAVAFEEVFFNYLLKIPANNNKKDLFITLPCYSKNYQATMEMIIKNILSSNSFAEYKSKQNTLININEDQFKIIKSLLSNNIICQFTRKVVIADTKNAITVKIGKLNTNHEIKTAKIPNFFQFNKETKKFEKMAKLSDKDRCVKSEHLPPFGENVKIDGNKITLRTMIENNQKKGQLSKSNEGTIACTKPDEGLPNLENDIINNTEESKINNLNTFNIKRSPFLQK